MNDLMKYILTKYTKYILTKTFLVTNFPLQISLMIMHSHHLTSALSWNKQ